MHNTYTEEHIFIYSSNAGIDGYLFKENNFCFWAATTATVSDEVTTKALGLQSNTAYMDQTRTQQGSSALSETGAVNQLHMLK